MRKDTGLLLLGVWITLLSYLGFPNDTKAVLFTLSGILVIGYGIVIRRGMRAPKSRPPESFAEQKPYQTS